MDTTQQSATSSSEQENENERPAPQHGEHAADLIFDTEAGSRFNNAVDGVGGGAWIYPAAYDDFWLCRRRAASLARGFGIPFSIALFGVDGGPGDEMAPSVAVSMPGYYAYTLADPRPRVIVIQPAEEN